MINQIQTARRQSAHRNPFTDQKCMYRQCFWVLATTATFLPKEIAMCGIHFEDSNHTHTGHI